MDAHIVSSINTTWSSIYRASINTSRYADVMAHELAQKTTSQHFLASFEFHEAIPLFFKELLLRMKRELIKIIYTTSCIFILPI